MHLWQFCVQVFLLAEVATEIFQENPTVFVQARGGTVFLEVNMVGLKLQGLSQLTGASELLMLQDVKRGRYPKLQSSDPSLLDVATKLGIQTESGARAAGVSVLPAETVRSLMLDKRKVQSNRHFDSLYGTTVCPNITTLIFWPTTVTLDDASVFLSQA